MFILAVAIFADQGPCPSGFEHVFDGYLSCALDAQPCARKVIVGDAARPVLMSECRAACADCVGLSLYSSTECWVYDRWVDDGAASRRHDEQSVICHKAQPPPPHPPPHPPPPPNPPPPPPPRPKRDIARDEVAAAKEHLKAAGGVMLEGIHPLVLAASAIGLAILAILILVASCLCMRCYSRPRSYAEDLDDAFDDDLDEEFEDGGFHSFHRGEERAGMRSAAAAEAVNDGPPQRVMVQAGGSVLGTLRVHTAGCRSVKKLRSSICAACRELHSGAREEEMELEYLDEAAGLAIVIATDAEMATALRMTTLKATFTRSAARKKAPSRKRPPRKRGYERGLRSEEDADDADDYDSDEYEDSRRCVLQ